MSSAYSYAPAKFMGLELPIAAFLLDFYNLTQGIE